VLERDRPIQNLIGREWITQSRTQTVDRSVRQDKTRTRHAFKAVRC
jgi:hypothetical protein